ncbi:unnamed protein product, partial [Meganyctiphanes norvegica]
MRPAHLVISEKLSKMMYVNIIAGSRWVESVFNKRECCKFIPSSRDNARCCCGQLWQYHADGSPATLRTGEGEDLHWSPQRHTHLMPTDAYGTLEFQGGAHPTKAQYIRLAHDTRPENILALMSGEWGLDLPKLLITVIGGKTNFDLQPKLKKVIRKGLLKAAKTTGAWVLTAGTNTGVTRHVGEAFVESSLRAGVGRVVSVGIAPWGIIERRQDLIGHDRDVQYALINTPKSKFAAPNSHHTHFLLVDNGTTGKYGAELILRRKLENYLSQQRIEARGGLATPVVSVVIEGGPQTIRQVLEFVTDNPPVPVVVCDGTGRAADILAFVHKYAGLNMIEANRDTIILTLMRVFELRDEQAEKLFAELLQCMRKKELINIFRLKEGAELDRAILSALLHSKQLNPLEQLSLVLTWNRVDIARSHVFNEEVEWQEEGLEQAMMDALVNDRIEFVKLLLEQGVTMNKFLTIQRLEDLYNSKQGPANTLRYIVRDICKNVTSDYRYSLIEIGLVVNKLMGGAYRSTYTRKKFRNMYGHIMNKTPRVNRKNSLLHPTRNILQKTYSSKSYSSNIVFGQKYEFDYPFSELMVWAVLTKRQEMAKLMWHHGEEAVAKALVAAKLYKALAREAADDDLETEVYNELRVFGKEFENLALEVLVYCYQQDDYRTHQLLTYELKNWSKQTCLSLAVAVNHRALLSHSCCQILLADLWLGGLRTRKSTNIKVLCGLLCPPIIPYLGFRSREELKTMPQTRGEYQEEEHGSFSDSESDSSSEDEALDMRNDHDPETPIINHSSHNQAPHSVPISEGATENEASNLTLNHNGPQCISQHNTQVNLDATIFSESHKRQLPIRTKFYEFYNAPISKFWSHSIAYIFFLCLFTYVVLVKLPKNPDWMEWYVAAYIFSLLLEKMREILSTEPVKISQKMEVWTKKLWNPFDLFFVLLFLLALVLRLQNDTFVVGRVIYCVDIIYWYVRLLEILSANKYLGPLIMMIGKMVKNMSYFVVLLIVVLMAFGVCRQSILYPNEEPRWQLARHIFYQPYFMLYGEVFADEIDPPCGDECQPGHWITPIVMSLFLLCGNILLISLLIAVFNNIFNEVNSISHQVWMFQRFRVVMEFEEKPVFPAPLIIISHIYRAIKYFYQRYKSKPCLYDQGLKLFLDGENLERIHDFEEDCVDGYNREKLQKDQMSTDERVRVMAERTEGLLQRIEDMHSKFVSAMTSITNLDFHVKHLEETVEQTKNSYFAVHQFMKKYMGELGRSSSPHSPSHSGSVTPRSEYGGSSKSISQTSLHRLLEEAQKQMLPKEQLDTQEQDDADQKTEIKQTVSKTPQKTSKPALHSERRHKETEGYKSSGVRRRVSNTSRKDSTSQKDSASCHYDDVFKEQGSRKSDAFKEQGSRKSNIRNARKKSCREKPFSPSRVCFIESRAIEIPMESAVQTPSLSSPIYERRTSDMSRPRIQVIPPSTPPLLPFATEYTSLAHELETVCMSYNPLSPHPPHYQRNLQPNLRRRYASESGTARNSLKVAEESDYFLMEGLIQRRMHRDSENLAASLEDLCHILSEASDHEDNASIHSSSPRPTTLTCNIGIERSASGHSAASLESNAPNSLFIPRGSAKELGSLPGSPGTSHVLRVHENIVWDSQTSLPKSVSVSGSVLSPKKKSSTNSLPITSDEQSGTREGSPVTVTSQQEPQMETLQLPLDNEETKICPKDKISETSC